MIIITISYSFRIPIGIPTLPHLKLKFRTLPPIFSTPRVHFRIQRPFLPLTAYSDGGVATQVSEHWLCDGTDHDSFAMPHVPNAPRRFSQRQREKRANTSEPPVSPAPHPPTSAPEASGGRVAAEGARSGSVERKDVSPVPRRSTRRRVLEAIDGETGSPGDADVVASPSGRTTKR